MMAPLKERVEVFMEGEKIADTKRAILLLEPGYPDRIYISRENIYGIQLIKFSNYHCPFKGEDELNNIKHGPSIFHPEKVQLIRVTG